MNQKTTETHPGYVNDGFEKDIITYKEAPKFKISEETSLNALKNNIPKSAKRIKRFSILFYCLKALIIILWTWVIIKFINN